MARKSWHVVKRYECSISGPSFEDLLESSKLRNNIGEKKFEEPTEIQSLVIPAFNRGENLLGLARTGTGKTAAYLLPIIDKATRLRNEGTKSLILTPTPELVHQAASEFRSFAKGLRLKMVHVAREYYSARDSSKLRERPNV